MKKKRLSVLISLFLLSCMLLISSGSAATAFTSPDAVEAFMASCAESSASDFTISCNSETFAALSADDFALLHVLEARCGIAQAELRYSESGRTFLFDHVVYDRFPYAECADEAAVQQAVSRFAESRTRGVLTIPRRCWRYSARRPSGRRWQAKTWQGAS